MPRPWPKKSAAPAGARPHVLADVSDPDAAAALVATAIRSFGRLDILVNNASVRREIDFADLDYKEWRDILATTLDGAYLCSRAALPHLIASGGGAIVNIGGLSSHTGAPRRAHVIAAKAGLVGLTRALAHDLAPHHVTVNCVAPGLVDTARSGPEPAHHKSLATPVGRKGRPEEIAGLVRFPVGRARGTSPARPCTPTAVSTWGSRVGRVPRAGSTDRARPRHCIVTPQRRIGDL